MILNPKLWLFFNFFEKYFSVKYVRLIFGGKVLKTLTCFQFLICRKIIESSLDPKYTRVTKLTQEQKKFGWMKNYFLSPLRRFFLYITEILDINMVQG